MAKFGSALEKYIKDFDNRINEGLVAVGNKVQSELKANPNIQDRIIEGRLSDSISWSTTKHSSDLGPNAESGDHVPTPEEAGTVYVGTSCPYALVHEHGGGVVPFQFGQNGNPSSHNALVEKLQIWCRARGIDESFAEKIARNIENGNQQAYPFFYATVAPLTSEIADIFGKRFVASFKKQYINEEKI